MLRYFGFSAFLTIVSVLAVLLTLGPNMAVTTCVLIAIEIAFSFDNAIINAKVLQRLSPLWQRLFLTVGMVVAIVGMRFVFPIMIVMITAHLPWSKVIDDALHHPVVYGQHLAAAHVTISAFGGSFLLVLALYFLLDDSREVLWLKRIERPLQRLGGSLWLPPALAVIGVGSISLFAGENTASVLRAGLFGAAAYTLIKLFIDALGRLSGDNGRGQHIGWAAFVAFMYLQLLDASFSFDGVLGAFAITDKVLLIVIGLGVGAVWVRSLTVFMVHKGTLDAYQYLEHGAHYAILALAVALLSSIFFEVPNGVTGIVGLGVIVASFIASRQALHAKQTA